MSQDFTVKGKTLTIEKNDADFKSCDGKIDTVVVAGTVDMTTISELPDEITARVKKVVFCEGITHVDATFSYCKCLKTIEFPESLESIGPKAFCGCVSLKEITIPKNVKDIYDEAFAQCSNLRTVNGDLFNILHINVFRDTKFASRLQKNDLIIYDGLVLDGSQCYGDVVVPNGVREIVAGAFRNNTHLHSIIVPDGVQVSHSAFRGCINLEEATMPADMSIIGENLFLDCFKLKTIRFPESNIEEVFANAFTNTLWLAERHKDHKPLVLNGILVDGRSCKGEVAITGVRKIAGGAFRDNLDLTGVVISDECELIGYTAFYDCNFLKTVKLPAGLKVLGNSAFCGCDHLEEVSIPSGLETIPYNAFNCCLSLKSVRFPHSLKKIQNWAFYNCKDLKDYSIPVGTNVDPKAFSSTSDNKIGKVVEVRAVKKCVKENSYKDRSDLCVAIIPEGVTVIERYAFFNCRNLRKVILPQTLRKIEYSAFEDCTKLETIEFPEGIEYIERSAFESTALKRVVLPASLKKVEWAFDYCSDLLLVDIRCGRECVESGFYDRWSSDPTSGPEENATANVAPPIFWHLFSFLYLVAAGIGIWAHFSDAPDLLNAMVVTCLSLLPGGFLVDKCCSILGLWENVSIKKPSKLGKLLYAPALLVPLAIIGYPLFHFLHLAVPFCFLIATATIMLIVFVVDTCLNVYKEQFVLFFQDLYEGIYEFLHDYVWNPVKNYLFKPIWKYVLDPIFRFLERCLEKLFDGVVWLYKHVLKPLNKFLKQLFTPIWHFIKFVMIAIKDFINAVLCWLITHIIEPFFRKVVIPVVRPLYKGVRFIIVDVVFECFLKYILIVVGSLIRIAGGFFKVVFGWVLNDANGVVNYFITIPLIVLSIIGALFYFFFS